MRAHAKLFALAAMLLASCGLEGMIGNVGRSPLPRASSAISGATWAATNPTQITVTDGDLNALAPFSTSVEGGGYTTKLPSSTYSMIMVHGRAGDTELRAIVPSIGMESSVSGVDLDARNMTETLIVEAAMSAKGMKFKELTPAAYVGDGVTTGTRTLIRAAFDATSPTTTQKATQDLLGMVERLLAHGDPLSGVPYPVMFNRPTYDASYNVTTVNGALQSALDANWLILSRIDYTGDGIPDTTSAAFDQQLGAVAKLYKPEGCLDPTHIRLMFTVDFNQGTLDGNCSAINRFKWAVDKPGKSMFFVGWIFTNPPGPPPAASEVYDANTNTALGAGVPNTIPMHDDGTNGDEAAGDGIWTVAFEVPYDPAKRLRIGYKYTWGFQGNDWTGSEEWPGNSRILEVVDVNGDGFVYRRDVFQDEATNKDFSNLSIHGTGSIDWPTDLRGCGVPESHEQGFVLHNACACGGPPHTPTSLGPIRIACTE
jgi:hypothetical protein